MKHQPDTQDLPRRKFLRQTLLAGAGIALTPAFISTANTNSTHTLNPMTLNIKSHLSEMDKQGKEINILVGSKTFTATLFENETVENFLQMLPMTVEMADLNRNEKLYRLPKNLPTNPSSPGTIHAGDLMLWGTNTLVMFYETFPTSYPYTRLGQIKNPVGLNAALGAENVTVQFSKMD